MPASTYYEIRVRGHLSREWSEWFEQMTVAQESDGITTLTGQLTDQAALYGVLIRIRNLGLPLLSVNLIDETFKRSRENEHTENDGQCG